MRLFVLLIVWMASTVCHAVEFFEDGRITTSVSRDYWLQREDTLGGYPIFSRDPVQYSKGGVGSATGGDRSLKMPWIIADDYANNGTWLMGHITTVTAGSNSTNGWTGDPCGGESIVKINRIRGSLDRCAVARVKPIRVAGKEVSTIEMLVIETNTGGRFYKVEFNINYEALGWTYSEVTNKDGRFASDLKSWMSVMLDAVVIAAGYDKPANAFDKVPPLMSVIDARPSSTKTSQTSSTTNSTLATTNATSYTFCRALGKMVIEGVETCPAPSVYCDSLGKMILEDKETCPVGKQVVKRDGTKSVKDRLEELKHLLDNKLIDKTDYEKKKAELLKLL